jgi:D-lactate dehydrogenase
MKVAVFSAKPYDRDSLDQVNEQFGHDLVYYDTQLSSLTTRLAEGFSAVSVFVNDDVDADTIVTLASGGTRLIATRSAGYNQIDLVAAAEHDIAVARVPAYSPNAVSEFTVGLMLTLARQIHRGYNRTRQNNFELDGLLGFELKNRTVGVIGTGKIGANVARALSGFGCKLLAFDMYENSELDGVVRYTSLEEIGREACVITFHVPLTPETYHIVNERTIAQFRRGVMLINTSRGALFDTPAVIEGLKSGQIGSLGIDVYEEEAHLFFQDLSNQVVQDDVFARLLTFPNVVVTAHQAFFSDEALSNIAETTLANISEFERTGQCTNAVTAAEMHA